MAIGQSNRVQLPENVYVCVKLTPNQHGDIEKEIHLGGEYMMCWQEGWRHCVGVHHEAKKVPGISPASTGSKLHRRRKIISLIPSYVQHVENTAAQTFLLLFFC